MQSYEFHLSGTRQVDVINIYGEKFVYESTSTATESRIRVKPDNGGEVVVRAGQWFEPEGGRAERFTVRAFNEGDTVNGWLVIGVGDFGDNATSSTVAGIVAVSSGDLAVNNVKSDAAPVVVRASKLSTVTQGTIAVGLSQVLISGDPDLQTISVRNNHATAQIAIGLSGLMLGSAVIVLQPNDVWSEEKMAGASWYAVSDLAGGTIAFLKGKG